MKSPPQAVDAVTVSRRGPLPSTWPHVRSLQPDAPANAVGVPAANSAAAPAALTAGTLRWRGDRGTPPHG
ncbi:hypothetical protein EJ357_02210 [Streptomyces cyaneochromogenes]|uniref:Uncharacterized protein n=1 Tax=Streptomyces cyaneochromogenes TaxID=2496836 RepID=A0A3Q9EKX5_9ACTN|nr:hypothetical protein [Streptomyces cyaneochromogenes]AZQ32407.1 hypothetical protein EJ357_02210 [Streptomyces cyaneochromogenes]